ncbi:bone morphogenetic protein receptor type-2-like isoform X1 [Acipenser ruthenus]|uniref:bone morphogenetic protein receptor type-2-like isoform X1 n=1 Tax=Acipenser ruthenus TaxID=7906 RepID=UPI0027405BCB|nr:bone morphogenetic protein receptor type-2-like isoform X1 [Acipenser ruthenus]
MTRRLSDALRLILIVALAGTGLTDGRKCVYSIGSPDHRAVVEIGNVNGTVQHCARTDCCIAAVHLLNNNTNITTQGCSVIQGSCTDLLCLLGPLRRGNYTSCVCSSDLCNSHVAWSQDAEGAERGEGSRLAPLAWVLTVGVPLLCLLTGAWKWRDSRRRLLAHQLSLQDLPQTEKVQATTSPTSLTSPRLDLTNMELHQVINRGRYAELWKGSLEGVPVVFKLYPSGCCRCYDNESTVYGLALLRHPSITCFLGEGESGQSGARVLVLELAQHGSLRAFLSQHCSDWAGTVRLALSLCQGLSFLHSEIHRDGVYKPAVAHRDLSSNNVLVKADWTCALSDFGSATALNLRPGPRPLRTQEVCVQVGTPRYMPPEILDGTLNIRDPLSSLRQVDVYSLGLLVWEMTTRCTDLWTVSPVPEYRPAYEAELGPSPSLDELILLVSERRKRPALTHLCRGTTLGCGALMEILKHCWDNDPEARLTAPCTEKRLSSV